MGRSDDDDAIHLRCLEADQIGLLLFAYQQASLGRLELTWPISLAIEPPIELGAVKLESNSRWSFKPILDWPPSGSRESHWAAPAAEWGAAGAQSSGPSGGWTLLGGQQLELLSLQLAWRVARASPS